MRRRHRAQMQIHSAKSLRSMDGPAGAEGRGREVQAEGNREEGLS